MEFFKILLNRLLSFFNYNKCKFCFARIITNKQHT